MKWLFTEYFTLINLEKIKYFCIRCGIDGMKEYSLVAYIDSDSFLHVLGDNSKEFLMRIMNLIPAEIDGSYEGVVDIETIIDICNED